MKKILLATSLVASTLLFATSHDVKVVEVTHLNTHAKVAPKKAHSTHWGYTGHEAPQYWGDINPKYKMCKEGVNQSPINISKDITIKTSNLPKIGFEYYADAKEVVNNGHAIQVNVDNYSSIDIDGKHFSLKQFHFHTPSENQIDGKNFPLEAHFVHAAKDGSLAVIAVMFEDGKKNEIINKIWNRMPKKAGTKVSCGLTAEMINALLPEDKAYYRFDGSLTTPPCSEGVRWFVMKDYLQISKDEVEEFLHTMHHPNNRPVQPVNARKVLQ